MISLTKTLSDYLAMRRALGFQLHDTERCLSQFVRFVQTEGAAFITTELALRWAGQPTRASPAHQARRLGMVRQFASYCHALDTRNEIPPVGLLPYRYRRKTPYLYSDEELDRLLQAARQLPSPTGLRAATYATLLGLLIVTGMRISEPIALDRSDVDLDLGTLTIRRTKFAKSRWLPLHPTTGQALQQYAALRERWLAHLEGTLLRPVLLIDEAQEMNPKVLNELRLLSSTQFDSRTLLSVVLAGDGRLTHKLRREELLPLGSRLRLRLAMTYAEREELLACLKHLQVSAGNPGLMTLELSQTLCDHALGNYRVLTAMAAELLAAAAQQEITQLDEKLYLQVFTTPTASVRKPNS